MKPKMNKKQLLKVLKVALLLEFGCTCTINIRDNTNRNVSTIRAQEILHPINSSLVQQLTVRSTYYDGDSLVMTSTTTDFVTNNLLVDYYSKYAEKVRAANAEMRLLSKEHKERAMIDFPYYCQQADSIILSKPVTITPVANHSKKDLYFRYGEGPISETERNNASITENDFLFVFTPFGNVDIVYKKGEELLGKSPKRERLIVVDGKVTKVNDWHTLFVPEVRDFVDNITFMSEEESVKKYGEAGLHGAIIFTMKSGYSDELLQEWSFRSTLIELTMYGRYFKSAVMEPINNVREFKF